MANEQGRSPDALVVFRGQTRALAVRRRRISRAAGHQRDGPTSLPLSRLSMPHDLFGRVRFYFGAAIAAGVVISILFAVVQWSCTTLTIERGYVVYAKGVLSRTVAKVPVQEIASIDLQQTLFHRILNTGNLVIDMRGASLLRMNLLNDPVGIQNTVLEMRQGGREDLR